MQVSDAEGFVGTFADWFDRQPSCLAMAVVGSWARETTRQARRLDLLVLTDDLGGWAADPGWLSIVLRTAGHAPTPPVPEAHGAARSWRTRPNYRSEVDVTFADASWARVDPVDPGTLSAVLRDLRVVRDPHGILARLLAAVARDAPQGPVDSGESCAP